MVGKKRRKQKGVGKGKSNKAVATSCRHVSEEQQAVIPKECPTNNELGNPIDDNPPELIHYLYEGSGRKRNGILRKAQESNPPPALTREVVMAQHMKEMRRSVRLSRENQGKTNVERKKPDNLFKAVVQRKLSHGMQVSMKCKKKAWNMHPKLQTKKVAPLQKDEEEQGEKTKSWRSRSGTPSSDDLRLRLSPDEEDEDLSQRPVVQESVDKVDGVEFVSFENESDLLQFDEKSAVPSQQRNCGERKRPTKTKHVHMIKGWRNKNFHTSDDAEGKSSTDEEAQAVRDEPQLSDPTLEEAGDKPQFSDLTLEATQDDTPLPKLYCNEILMLPKIEPHDASEESDLQSIEQHVSPEQAKKSAFISNVLDDYLTSHAKLNISYEIPKNCASDITVPEGMIVSPPMSPSSSPERRYSPSKGPKAKTLREKRLMLEQASARKVNNVAWRGSGRRRHRQGTGLYMLDQGRLLAIGGTIHSAGPRPKGTVDNTSMLHIFNRYKIKNQPGSSSVRQVQRRQSQTSVDAAWAEFAASAVVPPEPVVKKSVPHKSGKKQASNRGKMKVTVVTRGRPPKQPRDEAPSPHPHSSSSIPEQIQMDQAPWGRGEEGDVPLSPPHPSSPPPDQKQKIRGPVGRRGGRSFPWRWRGGGKRTAINRELKRLGATFIDVEKVGYDSIDPADPAEKASENVASALSAPAKSSSSSNDLCGKDHCSLGCVCESIRGEWAHIPEHCGRVECMFQCRCRDGSWKQRTLGTKKLSLLNPAVLARIEDESNQNLAPNEKEFKSTVIRAANEVMMVSERRKRETKIPEKFRDSVMTKDVLQLLARGSTKNFVGEDIPVSSVMPKHKATVSPKVYQQYILDDPKLQLEPQVRTKRLNMGNVKPLCMDHLRYCCKCSPLQGKKPKAVIPKFPKVLIAYNSIQGTVNAGNVERDPWWHDEEKFCARTSGIRHRWPIPKRDGKGESRKYGVPNHDARDPSPDATPAEPEANDTCNIVITSVCSLNPEYAQNQEKPSEEYELSLPSEQLDVSELLGNRCKEILERIDFGGSSDRQLMRWSHLKRLVLDELYIVWYVQDSRNRLLMTTKDAQPRLSCTRIQDLPPETLTHLPDMVAEILAPDVNVEGNDFEMGKLAILGKRGIYWEWLGVLTKSESSSDHGSDDETGERASFLPELFDWKDPELKHEESEGIPDPPSMAASTSTELPDFSAEVIKSEIDIEEERIVPAQLIDPVTGFLTPAPAEQLQASDNSSVTSDRPDPLGDFLPKPNVVTNDDLFVGTGFSYDKNVRVPTLGSPGDPQKVLLPVTPASMVWALVRVDDGSEDQVTIPNLRNKLPRLRLQTAVKHANVAKKTVTVIFTSSACGTVMPRNHRLTVYALPGITTHVFVGPYYPTFFDQPRVPTAKVEGPQLASTKPLKVIQSFQKSERSSHSRKQTLQVRHDVDEGKNIVQSILSEDLLNAVMSTAAERVKSRRKSRSRHDLDDSESELDVVGPVYCDITNALRANVGLPEISRTSRKIAALVSSDNSIRRRRKLLLTDLPEPGEVTQVMHMPGGTYAIPHPDKRPNTLHFADLNALKAWVRTRHLKMKRSQSERAGGGSELKRRKLNETQPQLATRGSFFSTSPANMQAMLGDGPRNLTPSQESPKRPSPAKSKPSTSSATPAITLSDLLNNSPSIPPSARLSFDRSRSVSPALSVEWQSSSDTLDVRRTHEKDRRRRNAQLLKNLAIAARVPPATSARATLEMAASLSHKLQETSDKLAEEHAEVAQRNKALLGQYNHLLEDLPVGEKRKKMEEMRAMLRGKKRLRERFGANLRRGQEESAREQESPMEQEASLEQAPSRGQDQRKRQPPPENEVVDVEIDNGPEPKRLRPPPMLLPLGTNATMNTAENTAVNTTKKTDLPMTVEIALDELVDSVWAREHPDQDDDVVILNERAPRPKAPEAPKSQATQPIMIQVSPRAPSTSGPPGPVQMIRAERPPATTDSSVRRFPVVMRSTIPRTLSILQKEDLIATAKNRGLGNSKPGSLSLLVQRKAVSVSTAKSTSPAAASVGTVTVARPVGNMVRPVMSVAGPSRSEAGSVMTVASSSMPILVRSSPAAIMTAASSCTTSKLTTSVSGPLSSVLSNERPIAPANAGVTRPVKVVGPAGNTLRIIRPRAPATASTTVGQSLVNSIPVKVCLPNGKNVHLYYPAQLANSNGTAAMPQFQVLQMVGAQPVTVGSPTPGLPTIAQLPVISVDSLNLPSTSNLAQNPGPNPNSVVVNPVKNPSQKDCA